MSNLLDLCSYSEQLKNIREENEASRTLIENQEKLIEHFVYFLNKFQHFYRKKENLMDKHISVKQLDLNRLQEEIIELENYIINLRNDKANSEGRYSKLVEIQSKISGSDFAENSKLHLDNVKRLNEKIFDLVEQNKILMYISRNYSGTT